MKFSYIGTRAAKDSADKKRYAEAKWKDGDMKAEDIGYIFRCLLKDYGYGFTTYSDGEICKITVEVKDYEEFEMIKVRFDEAKDACRR